jgi:hypothetical protein
MLLQKLKSLLIQDNYYKLLNYIKILYLINIIRLEIKIKNIFRRFKSNPKS